MIKRLAWLIIFVLFVSPCWAQTVDNFNAVDAADIDNVNAVDAANIDEINAVTFANTIAYQTYAENETGDTTSITINKPSGVVEGDLMIGIICWDGGQVGDVTPPSTWTTEWEDAGTANADCATTIRSTLGIYYKVAGPSEGASYQWSWNGDDSSGGYILRVTGQNATVVDNNGAKQCGSTATPVSPSITTNSANALVLRAYCQDDGNNLDSTGEACAGEPGGSDTCIDTDAVGSTGGLNWGVAYKVQAAAEATGAATWTTDGSQESIGVTISFKD